MKREAEFSPRVSLIYLKPGWSDIHWDGMGTSLPLIESVGAEQLLHLPSPGDGSKFTV